MTNSRLLPIVLWSLSSTLAAAAPAPAPEVIPPLYRAARHFEEGEKYLRALPEGSKITVHRLDGATFTLTLTGGKLATTLPPAQISEGGKLWTSSLGYQVFVNYQSTPPGLAIAAPGGAWSTFSFLRNSILIVVEEHGGFWTRSLGDPMALRLPDGVRIDMLENGQQWEALTLNGERFRLSLAAGVWTEMPRLPSPPLIPDMESLYLAGNGDNWRKPAQDDHVVFAWNWYPVGVSMTQAIDDVRTGFRREDLDGYFDLLPNPQSGPDMAACLLGRRLALGGGDQMTFEAPSQGSTTALLLPGPLDPNYLVLKDTLLKWLRPRTKAAPTKPD